MKLQESKWVLAAVVAGGLLCGTASFGATDIEKVAKKEKVEERVAKKGKVEEKVGTQDIDPQQLLDMVISKIDDPQVRKLLCQKGNFSFFSPSKTVISLRSLDGNACQNFSFGGIGLTFAALAAVLCDGYSGVDYDGNTSSYGPSSDSPKGSQCYQKNPIKSVDAGIKTLQPLLKTNKIANMLFCTKGRNFKKGGNFEKIAAACPEQPLAK